jgi:RNA polymerase sigma-70 factor (ECF subfamily)
VDGFVTIRLRALASAAQTEAEHKISAQPVAATTGQSDEALIARICEEDNEALSSLFRRYARIVRAVAYRVLRDGAEADDLVQDVFILIHGQCRTFDATRGSARLWILQIAFRRAISRRRYLTSRHFYRSVDIDEVAGELRDSRAQNIPFENPFFGFLDTSRMEKAFECLSDGQRQTLSLYFFEGYTLDEIATKLGQSRGNIKHHYFRGLDRLRKRIFGAKLLRDTAV